MGAPEPDKREFVVEVQPDAGAPLCDRWWGDPSADALARFVAASMAKHGIRPRRARIYDPITGIVLASWRKPG